MDREDGEMSDDNAMLVDDDEFSKVSVNNSENTCTVLYKTEKDGLVVQQLEKVDAAKLEERAKRFGVNLTGNRVITQKQIDELYANFGVEGVNQRHFRLDALYLNGVDGLNTKEIFEYLEDYKPLSLEWIDELSCNVVCQDNISAALALLVHSTDIKDKQLKEMLAEKSNHYWRLGMPHPKKDIILMRFATNGEKKKLKKVIDPKRNDQYYDQTMDSVSKNPWGDLCKSWGVYDHQEVFQRKLQKNDYEDVIEEEEPIKPLKLRNKKLALRLGKRHHEIEKNEESDSDSEWKSKSKTPRMRMHADDEETKIKKKHTAKTSKEVTKPRDKYAPLSIEVVNSETDYIKRESTKLSDKFQFHGGNKTSSIRSRLGEKISNHHNDNPDQGSSEELSEDNISDSEHNMMSKVQKVNTNSSNVWSRLDISQKNVSAGVASVGRTMDSQNDLRQVLKSKTTKKGSSSDLRERLGKSKHANLRIEIDNQ